MKRFDNQLVPAVMLLIGWSLGSVLAQGCCPRLTLDEIPSGRYSIVGVDDTIGESGEMIVQDGIVSVVLELTDGTTTRATYQQEF